VSVFGTNVAQSVSGQAQAERVESAERRKADRPAPREVRTRRDEHDTVVVDTESAQAVRHLAGNDQEQAHEDRHEHPCYTPRGAVSRADRDKARIDVQV
jgi:hypothetical protein